MKNSILIFAVIILATITSFAQKATTKNGTLLGQKYGLSVGYNGFKIANPGLQIGLEKYLATTQNFQVIGGLYLQFHTQKDKQTAFGLNARFGQRYTTNFGLMLESHLGIGVQQTRYTAQTFDLTTTPVTESTKNVSKLGLKPNIAMGFGYDFGKKTDFPAVFYVRPSVSCLFPDVNLVLQTSINLEMGVVYRF
jgi:hypothetical protein